MPIYQNLTKKYLSDTIGISLVAIVIISQPKKKSIEIKTGCLSNSFSKKFSLNDLRITITSKKTNMGSVGSQKSKLRPGIILLRGIEMGTNNARAKKSLSGAKKTQKPARSKKGNELSINDCLYAKSEFKAIKTKLKKIINPISILLLCNGGRL